MQPSPAPSAPTVQPRLDLNTFARQVRDAYGQDAAVVLVEVTPSDDTPFLPAPEVDGVRVFRADGQELPLKYEVARTYTTTRGDVNGIFLDDLLEPDLIARTDTEASYLEDASAPGTAEELGRLISVMGHVLQAGLSELVCRHLDWPLERGWLTWPLPDVLPTAPVVPVLLSCAAMDAEFLFDGLPYFQILTPAQLSALADDDFQNPETLAGLAAYAGLTHQEAREIYDGLSLNADGSERAFVPDEPVTGEQEEDSRAQGDAPLFSLSVDVLALTWWLQRQAETSPSWHQAWTQTRTLALQLWPQDEVDLD